MTCPVHKIDDGYDPEMPEGTMLRAQEDLRHAFRVLGEQIVAALQSLSSWERSQD